MFIVHCSCSLFIVPTVLLSSLMMFFSAIHTNTGKGERLQMLTKHLELLYVVFSVECTPAGRRHIDYRVDTFKAYTHALHRPS